MKKNIYIDCNCQLRVYSEKPEHILPPNSPFSDWCCNTAAKLQTRLKPTRILEGDMSREQS